MNDIIQKDVKTYVRTLIAETLGSMTDDTNRHNRLQKEENRENSPSKTNQTKEILKE